MDSNTFQKQVAEQLGVGKIDEPARQRGHITLGIDHLLGCLEAVAANVMRAPEPAVVVDEQAFVTALGEMAMVVAHLATVTGLSLGEVLHRYLHSGRLEKAAIPPSAEPDPVVVIDLGALLRMFPPSDRLN